MLRAENSLLQRSFFLVRRHRVTVKGRRVKFEELKNEKGNHFAEIVQSALH